MTDPREPGVPEEPGISLPSWVDDAIQRTRKPGAEHETPDAGPASELVANQPPANEAPPLREGLGGAGPSEPGSAAEGEILPPTAPPPSHDSGDAPSPIVVAQSPREARRRTLLPWVALALLLLGAALVLAYILLTRPVQT